MVAHNPLDRSGRAVLPHPALASGDDAEAAQGIGMMVPLSTLLRFPCEKLRMTRGRHGSLGL
jgi:hypothetical protein